LGCFLVVCQFGSMIEGHWRTRIPMWWNRLRACLQAKQDNNPSAQVGKLATQMWYRMNKHLLHDVIISYLREEHKIKVSFLRSNPRSFEY
jgi:hypothetical protein